MECMKAETDALQAAARVAARSGQPSRAWLEAVPPEEVSKHNTPPPPPPPGATGQTTSLACFIIVHLAPNDRMGAHHDS